MTVLTLADQLVPGHVLYFDRYFNSQKLADELNNRGILCTGTLMRNRIPHGCQLKDDQIMKSECRGSTHVLVRPDGKLAVTKWFDNKPIILLSTIEAEAKSGFCQHWCKKTKIKIWEVLIWPIAYLQSALTDIKLINGHRDSCLI